MFIHWLRKYTKLFSLHQQWNLNNWVLSIPMLFFFYFLAKPLNDKSKKNTVLLVTHSLTDILHSVRILSNILWVLQDELKSYIVDACFHCNKACGHTAGEAVVQVVDQVLLCLEDWQFDSQSVLFEESLGNTQNPHIGCECSSFLPSRHSYQLSNLCHFSTPWYSMCSTFLAFILVSPFSTTNTALSVANILAKLQETAVRLPAWKHVQ